MANHPDFSPVDEGQVLAAAEASLRPDAPAALAESIHELGRIVLADTPLEDVFSRVAELARDNVPGADEVSVTMVTASHPLTFASTGELALDLDERQYSEDIGPCLHAAREGEVVLIDDMRAEPRWRSYTVQAAQAGALSSLSTPLPLRGQTVGALNIYSRSSHAFDGYSRELAEHFAGYAAVAMTNASLYAATADLAEQMQEAIHSRAVIEQAKGIIMGERRCSADEAFDLLAKLSQDSNRKLRDVAAALVAQIHPAR